ncbi:hypothetical protein Tco_1446421 [Tanacetum coccineum]
MDICWTIPIILLDQRERSAFFEKQEITIPQMELGYEKISNNWIIIRSGISTRDVYHETEDFLRSIPHKSHITDVNLDLPTCAGAGAGAEAWNKIAPRYPRWVLGAIEPYSSVLPLALRRILPENVFQYEEVRIITAILLVVAEMLATHGI